MKILKLSTLACTILITALISCTKEETNNPTPLVTKTDSIQVAFDPGAPNTFFNFKNE